MKDEQAFISVVQIGQRRFNPVGCLVKLAHPSFNARNNLESSFPPCVDHGDRACFF